MSMCSTVFPVCLEKSTAPAPLAASTLSRSGPAVATTNSPAKSDRASSTARAFSLRLVSPVMMMAPVSTLSRRMPAFRYSSATSSRSTPASTWLSSSRGVKYTGLR